MVDYGYLFMTRAFFESREELISLDNQMARKKDMVILIKRSDNVESGRHPRCERSGTYCEPRKMLPCKNVRVLVN